MTSYRNFGVVGGGAWGTALAQLLAADGVPVRLWAREAEVVAAINAQHRNPVFLPGATLSASLTATGTLTDMADLDALLIVVPVPFLRAVLAELPPGDAPLVFCSKGMEAGSFAFPIDMARDLAPERPHAVLSGPTFAHDVAAGAQRGDMREVIQIVDQSAQIALHHTVKLEALTGGDAKIVLAVLRAQIVAHEILLGADNPAWKLRPQHHAVVFVEARLFPLGPRIAVVLLVGAVMLEKLRRLLAEARCVRGDIGGDVAVKAEAALLQAFDGG